MIIIDISKIDTAVAIEQLKSLADIHSTIECQIDFATDHSQSKIIRDFIGYIFDIHHVDSLWKGRFVLITDELVNNAIEHWSNIGDIDSCIIRASKDEQWVFSIILEVHDTGRGKDSKDVTHMAKVKDKILEEHNERGIHMEKRGRGLFYITEKLVDRLSFCESIKWGLAVRVEKNIAVTKQ